MWPTVHGAKLLALLVLVLRPAKLITLRDLGCILLKDDTKVCLFSCSAVGTTTQWEINGDNIGAVTGVDPTNRRSFTATSVLLRSSPLPSTSLKRMDSVLLVRTNIQHSLTVACYNDSYHKFKMNDGLNTLNITGIESPRVDYNTTFSLYRLVNETLLSNETSSVLIFILETSCLRISFQSYSCSQNLWSDDEKKRLCYDFYRDNQSSLKVLIAVNATSINVTCLDNGLEIILPESKLETLPELSTVEIPTTAAATHNGNGYLLFRIQMMMCVYFAGFSFHFTSWYFLTATASLTIIISYW